jgi:F-type H+-transporting ATPase subunit delta
MSVARTYASALLGVLPRDAAALDQAEGQLSAFAALLAERADVRAVLSGPLTSTQEKAALVSALASRLGCSQLVTRFLEVCAQKGRLAWASEILAAFRAVRVEAEGGVLGALESADPLSDADVADLSRAFTQVLGKKVFLAAKVNPGLLAGLRVTVMGTTYDGSLQSQLARLKKKMVETSFRNH